MSGLRFEWYKAGRQCDEHIDFKNYLRIYIYDDNGNLDYIINIDDISIWKSQQIIKNITILNNGNIEELKIID